MKTVGNVLWAILVGWELLLIYGLIGVLCCITLLFIPVGLQYFKLARLAIWPFGYRPTFTKVNGFKIFLNVVWAIFFGWENAVLCYVVGAILCCTIILIPCGLQLFKFGRLVFLPLGTTIEKIA
jgi:uncharacterized membrane protein YccF (DUF307 family)